MLDLSWIYMNTSCKHTINGEMSPTKPHDYYNRSEMESLSVTVAIPAYNAEKYLSPLLSAVFEQTRVPDEVMVIDDGSRDRTRRIARRSDVKLIVHNENRGLASARNSALQHSGGDIIVFFDADSIPDPQNVERMLKAYRYPEVAGVGGQEFFQNASNKIDLWRNHFWRQTHGSNQIDSAWMLMGLCSSYRKDALAKVGGFDETYRTNGEDVDMGIRLSKLGYRLVYLPEVGVHHIRKDRIASMLGMAFRHSFWQSRALRKNGINPVFQMKAAIFWLLVSSGSSLKRNKDIFLTLLSPVICTSAIAGRIIERIVN